MWTNKLNLRGLQIRKLVDKTYFPIFPSPPLLCCVIVSVRADGELKGFFLVICIWCCHQDIILYWYLTGNVQSCLSGCLYYPLSNFCFICHSTEPALLLYRNEKSHRVRTNREPSNECVIINVSRAHRAWLLHNLLMAGLLRWLGPQLILSYINTLILLVENQK